MVPMCQLSVMEIVASTLRPDNMNGMKRIGTIGVFNLDYREQMLDLKKLF